MKTDTQNPLKQETPERVFIGIDYHKKYSLYQVIDGQGASVARGRIEHRQPEDFQEWVRR